MHRWITAAVVLLPLAITGCKKKGETEAPAEDHEPMQVTWSFGEVSYEGGHMSDSMGSITYPLTVQNPFTDKNVVVASYTVGVKGADGRVCVADGDEPTTIGPEGKLTLKLTGDCMWSKLPEAGDLQLAGVVNLRVGGEEMKNDVMVTAKFPR